MGGYGFVLQANGAKIDGFEIEKTDKTGPQNIILISPLNSIAVTNNTIHGQWELTDNDVSRAMEVAGGATDLTISGNEIYGLRQPAYINGLSTGTVSNNYVHGTKGWVLEGANLTFTGNTFANNIGDIAILAQVPAGYYTDIVAMSAANNGAVVEDQRMSPAQLAVVYVDDDGAAGGNGTQANPLQTIEAGVERVVAGGTVHVADGNYTPAATIQVNKALSIIGPASGEAVVTGGAATGIVFNITSSNVTIQKLSITLAAAPTSTANGLISIPWTDGNTLGPQNINILDNKIYVAAQAGLMNTWNGKAIDFGRRITASTVSGNEIYNTRGGVVVYYVSELTITDNVIYNTKGGIQLYTNSQEQASLYTIRGNSWTTVHNEWDIVWNSVVYNMDMQTYVLAVSQANNDGYVVSNKTGAIGNRSHVFVAPGGTTTLKADNGNMNVPYAKVQDGIDAAVPGGTVFVAAGTYGENIQVNKAVKLIGAGRDVVTLQGVAPATDSGSVQITASNVTIDGFTIKGLGNKTIRITQPTANLVLKNNKVIAGSNTSLQNGWSAFETNYGSAQSNHLIENNIFEGQNSSQLLYYNPQINNLTMKNNKFIGSMLPMGLVVGFDGLDGNQVFEGNDFSEVASNYALLEVFGTYNILNLYNNNTWPDGYIPTQNKVALSTVVFPSTNDINRAKNWAHVNLVNIDQNGVMTFDFVQPRGFSSCIEIRTDGDTSQASGTNYNAQIPDGLYPFRCRYAVGTTRFTVNPHKYVEFRLSFGSEKDERFNWTRFDGVNKIYVDDNWVGLAAGASVTPSYPAGAPVAVIGTNAFASMAEAITAADEGIEVFVAAGAYTSGSAVVNKVKLTFHLQEGVVISGSDPCFDIQANYTRIYSQKPGEAKCAISGGTNGVAVSAGLLNIVIQGLEIDGTGGATGSGIHFAGAITDVQVLENKIHGFTQDGVHFSVLPANVVEVQGNLFKNNTGVGLFSPADFDATYNSWGHLGGPTAGDGDGVAGVSNHTPFTHVEVFLDSASTVAKNQNIVVQVKADLVNVTGATFDLAYDKTKLEVVSIVDGSIFSAVQGASTQTTHTPGSGKIQYAGWVGAAQPAKTVTGGTLYTVTFKGIGAGDAALAFNNANDLFAMAPGYGSSNFIYANDLKDGQVKVLDLLAVTGTFSMQGRSVRAGIPVTLTAVAPDAFGPFLGQTIELISNNLVLNNVVEATYTITTSQPRYLNVSVLADTVNGITKTKAISAATILTSLQLKGGNANYADNIVDVSDAGVVGNGWGTGTISHNGDVNFSGAVDLLDLSLVGANYGLTSAVAYGSWLP